MCLLLVAFRQHPEYPLVVAANRDEFHGRPTEAAAWRGDVLCGLDLEAGGTWMGVNRVGRFAAVTNYRDPAELRGNLRSRGLLVYETLHSPGADPQLRLELERQAADYAGFNLLFGSPAGLNAVSNRGPSHCLERPGMYGLSNHLFETPWPKVERGKRLLLECLHAAPGPQPEAMLALLADRHQPLDEELPATGVSLGWERRLAPIFIAGDDYGTRSSTVLIYRRDGSARFAERRFDPEGIPAGTQLYDFDWM